MIHLKSLKLQIPPALKVIIVVCYTVLLALLVSCSVYEVYHFPNDLIISDYPSTHWQCDKLGLEFYVDDTGEISGFLDVGSEVVSLDVTARSATTSHSNYIRCVGNDSSGCILHLYCFYRNVDNGEFYVIVDSSETTLDLNVPPDEIPYKCVLVEN